MTLAKKEEEEEGKESRPPPRFIGLLPILSRAQNAAKHGQDVCVYIFYTHTRPSRITRRYRHGK